MAGPHAQTIRGVVCGEIQAVLMQMRRSPRWAHMRQNPAQSSWTELVYKLKLARRTVASCTANSSSVHYIPAFLEVVRSEQTDGQVTEAALSAVHKLLQLDVLALDDELTARAAMCSIVSSVTHCRFEASDPASDEVVLMKLLQVLLACMRSTSQAQLTDEAVCEIVQACFRICAQPRLSVLLRRTAESTLLEIVWILFGRLDTLAAQQPDRSGAPPGEEAAYDGEGALPSPGLQPGVVQASSQADGSSLHLSDDGSHPHGVHVERGSAFDVYPAALEASETEGGPAAAGDSELSSAAQGAALDGAGARRGGAEQASARAADALGGGNQASQMAGRGDVVAFGSDDEAHALPATGYCLTGTGSTGSAGAAASAVPAGTAAAVAAGRTGVEDATAAVQGPSCVATAVPPPSIACDPIVAGGAGGVGGAAEAEEMVRTHGMACAYEVLRFLCSLVEPTCSNRSNTSEVHILGLTLIKCALEAGGSSYGRFPPLLRLIGAHLCKFLVQNSRTANLGVLSLVLQCTYLLYTELGACLRVQLELMLQRIYVRIVSARAASPEVLELAMESLLDLCEQPLLAVQLYTNYDCNPAHSDLLHALCAVLARNAEVQPGVPGLGAPQLLSLDALLALLRGLAACAAERRTGATAVLAFKLPAVASAGAGIGAGAGVGMAADEAVVALRASRRLKADLARCVEVFNRKPKRGVEALVAAGLVRDPPSPDSIAVFLRTAPGVDKQVVGDYLGEPDEANIAVLRAFARSFDFAGREIDVALRIFLEGFGLPGEAQKIDRVMELFAHTYYEQSAISGHGTPFRHPDAAYVLSFSIIMLNTDLHSAQIKKKMTLDEFVRNNRGINQQEDLPRELLADIFESIQREPIRLAGAAADLDMGLPVTNEAWEEVLQRSRSANLMRPHPLAGAADACGTASAAGPAAYPGALALEAAAMRDDGSAPTANHLLSLDSPELDGDAFCTLWPHVASAVTSTIDAAGPSADDVLERAFGGLIMCGQLCAAAGLEAIMGQACRVLLWYAVGGSLDAGGAEAAPGSQTGGSSGGCAGGAVDGAAGADAAFQHNRRAQMACYSLCLLAAECATAFGRDAWRAYGRLLVSLHCRGLLPDSALPPQRDRGSAHSTAVRGATTPAKALRGTSAERTGSAGKEAKGGAVTPRKTTVFANLLSALSIGADPAADPQPSEEEQAAMRAARAFVGSSCRLVDVMGDSKFLQAQSLDGLVDALIEASGGGLPASADDGAPAAAGDGATAEVSMPPMADVPACVPPLPRLPRPAPRDAPATAGAAGVGAAGAETRLTLAQAMCIEVLCEVALRNRDRAPAFWPRLHKHFAQVLTDASSAPLLVERALRELIRLCARLVAKEGISDLAYASLELALAMPAPTAAAISVQATESALRMVRLAAQPMRASERGWHVACALACAPAVGRLPQSPPLQRSDPLPVFTQEAAAGGLAVLSHIVEEAHTACAASFLPALQGLLAFARSDAVVDELRVRALELMQVLQARVAEVVVELCEVRTGSGAAECPAGECLPAVGPVQVTCDRHRVTSVATACAARGPGSETGEERGRCAPPPYKLWAGPAGASPAGAASADASVAEAEPNPLLACRTAADVWLCTWLPLVRAAGSCCAQVPPSLTDTALQALSRLLLVPELETLPAELSCLGLEMCLLPTLQEVLERRIMASAAGAGRTKGTVQPRAGSPSSTAADHLAVRCTALLSKAFVHFLPGLGTLPEFGMLWLKVLRLAEAFSHASRSEAVQEALPEHVRSMLVVMVANGLLRKPLSHPSPAPSSLSSALASKGVWEATLEALGQFCPPLQAALISEAAAFEARGDSREGGTTAPRGSVGAVTLSSTIAPDSELLADTPPAAGRGAGEQGPANRQERQHVQLHAAPEIERL